MKFSYTDFKFHNMHAQMCVGGGYRQRLEKYGNLLISGEVILCAGKQIIFLYLQVIVTCWKYLYKCYI